MPEQISKYPDVTLTVLKSAGAMCGEGVPQKILTKCPASRFCSLPGGEICVYGINEIPQMTQFTTKDLASAVCPKGQQGAVLSNAITGMDGLVLGAVLLAGLALGRGSQMVRRRR